MNTHSLPARASPTSLSVLNYATTLCVLTYFVGSNIFIRYRHKLDKRKPILKRKRILLVSLSSLVTSCYAIQALQYVPRLSTAPDDGLIHAIAQCLIWATLFLILLESTSISSSVWIGTPVVNLVLELALSIFSAAGPSAGIAPWAGPIQIVIIVLISIFMAITAILSYTGGVKLGTESETQSLLSHSSTDNKPIRNGHAGYDTLGADGSESDPDVDSDSDDDEEARKLQEQRLEASGSWFEYLKDFKVFLPYVVPKKDRRLQLYLVILFINILLQRALNILHPRQFGLIVDHLMQHRTIPWGSIFLWFLYQVASSNSCGVGAANEMIENRMSAWSRQQLTYASLDHVMGLSMSFHDQKDSGEVIKAIEQASSLNELLRLLTVDLAPAGLDIIISLWYVTYLLDVYASLIVAAMVIGFVYATYKITLLATVARRVSSREERDESKVIYESVGNWFTVTCFNQAKHTMGRLSRVVKERADAGLWNDDLYTYIYFFQEGAENLGRLAVTILAAHRIIVGRSTVGDLVTLQSYWETITWPLFILGHNYRRVNSALVDAERLLQLFQATPAIKDDPLAQTLPKAGGAVEMKDVCFAYEGREPTLHDVSLTVSPGQTVAFVGETGSGKSTLFKLLMRFYDVTFGSICIDGHDIRDITLSSLRDSFGFVPQDSVLFNMSIIENVRYGRLEATDKEVHEACKAASIHEKILSLPRGYASEVGERGVKLSGGERQRIAIARAFLKDAPIIVLDEATSAMDSQTEAKIQDALRKLTKGRTTFVIAHRLSTVVEADKIFVVSNGRIVEAGSHANLLELKGRYFELWIRQAVVDT